MPDEPRAAVAADLGHLVVATVHLSFVPGYNLRQLRQVVRWLALLGPLAVLVGDLNVPGPLPRLVSGWRSLASVKTFPASNPRLQVDHALGYALADGSLPEVAGAEARLLPLSDHRALIVQLGSQAWP
jgi:endonuclease/exonuclease/phosphatase family metal-dependent hydrolase